MESSPSVLAGRQRFQQAISLPDEQINLADAALCIAQEEYPDLDPSPCFQILEEIATRVRNRLPAGHYPLRLIQCINQCLYDELRFRGNTSNYYDPCNSFLNDVLDRRTGIPITLALVYLEVAKRIGLPMVGVGMPGHFLIRPTIADMEVYVDAFHRGEVLFAQDCRDRLNQVYKQPVPQESLPAFLEDVSSRRFLARMLTNLKLIYLNRNELEKSLAAVERILLLFPEVPTEVRDRGILYYHLDRWQESRQDLAAYLAKVPRAEDRAEVERLLERMSGGM